MLHSSRITYTICKLSTQGGKCLFDRGANGVVCGKDVRTISLSDKTLNVTGMDDHGICNLRIGTFRGVIPTQMGPVIAIFNQAAHNPTGKTIISCFQCEDNGLEIHDKSTAHGGRQCIVTPEGYIVGLDNHSGLMHVPIRPFTNSEAETLPTIIFTRDTPWDPSKHDLVLSNDTRWLSKQQNIPGSLHNGFDLTGEYIAQMHRVRSDGPVDGCLTVRTVRLMMMYCLMFG